MLGEASVTDKPVPVCRDLPWQSQTNCLRLVSKLRGGQSCFCDTSQTPASGSFNWTILISFINGVEWVLRSPRNDGGIKSDETNLILLASEAATLKYIKANSTIPSHSIDSRCG